MRIETHRQLDGVHTGSGRPEDYQSFFLSNSHRVQASVATAQAC